MRYRWLDYARGLGIMFIVLGHTAPPMKDYIFWFHVPLFFILSGFTFRLRDNEGFITFFKRKCRSLIYPYFSFGILAILLYWLVSGESITALPTWFFSLLFGTNIDIAVLAAFWFITTLFFTQLLLFLLIKWLPKKGVIILSLIAYASFYEINDILADTNILWALNLVPIATIYVVFGYYSKDFLKKKDASLATWLSLFVLAFLLFDLLAPYHFQFDMRALTANSIVLSLVIPIAISVLIIKLCHFLEPFELTLLAHMGQNSLVIMLTHYFFIEWLRLHDISSWWLNFLIAFTASYLLSELIASTPIKKILLRL